MSPRVRSCSRGFSTSNSSHRPYPPIWAFLIPKHNRFLSAADQSPSPQSEQINPENISHLWGMSPTPVTLRAILSFSFQIEPWTKLRGLRRSFVFVS